MEEKDYQQFVGKEKSVDEYIHPADVNRDYPRLYYNLEKLYQELFDEPYLSYQTANHIVNKISIYMTENYIKNQSEWKTKPVSKRHHADGTIIPSYYTVYSPLAKKMYEKKTDCLYYFIDKDVSFFQTIWMQIWEFLSDLGWNIEEGDTKEEDYSNQYVEQMIQKEKEKPYKYQIVDPSGRFEWSCAKQFIKEEIFRIANRQINYPQLSAKIDVENDKWYILWRKLEKHYDWEFAYEDNKIVYQDGDGNRYKSMSDVKKVLTKSDRDGKPKIEEDESYKSMISKLKKHYFWKFKKPSGLEMKHLYYGPYMNSPIRNGKRGHDYFEEGDCKNIKRRVLELQKENKL